jgi:DNA-directed RNA polymerase subunit alpha
MRIKWRGLELPNRVTSDRDSLTDTYGKFSVEPFERGFGVTVGNSLRRILLSSLEGSAVTRVKIQGVQHEITTIPGVVEDVTDIILNVKSLVVKNTSDQSRTIRIDRNQRGVVTAAHITTDEAVQIINPEHIIATLTDDVLFNLELTVENGRGYRTADENSGKEREIGVIPVDSSFSPVVRVKYEIEETRVGQRTNYDKLVMEIWTNGTISPELELSVRATNCLESEGITTVRDLVNRSDDELLEVRNFGETTLKEVKAKLAERNLHLGMKLPSSLRR